MENATVLTEVDASLVALLGALGWKVHCGRDGAGALDASGDFLVWRGQLYALTPEADALLLYLDHEEPERPEADSLPPSPVDIVDKSDATRTVPTKEPTKMLESDQWEDVLNKVTGNVYRGTERISSNALLNLLEVGPDPVIRQRAAKRLRAYMRRLGWTGPRAMRIPAENGHAAGSSGYWRLPSRPPQPAVNV
jgi:hypothetical protein